MSTPATEHSPLGLITAGADAAALVAAVLANPQALAAMQALAAGGVNVPTPAPAVASCTVSQAIDAYFAAKTGKLRRGSINSQSSRLRGVAAVLGGRELGSLTHSDADSFIAERVEQGVSLSFANQQIMGLITVCRLAVRRRLIRENPLHGFEFTAARTRRDRVYTPEEIARILDACVRADLDALFVVVSVMSGSGIRPIELLRTRRADVDFEAGTIFVPAETAKTGVARTVALQPEGANALRSFLSNEKRPSKFVFRSSRASDDKHMSYSAINLAWHKAVDIAGIKPNSNGTCAQIYSIRHSLASRLALELGFQPFELAAAMGWGCVDEAATYVKAQKTHLLASAARLTQANAAAAPVVMKRGRAVKPKKTKPARKPATERTKP